MIDESFKSGADIKEKQADIKNGKSNDSHLIKTKEKDAGRRIELTSRLKSDAKKKHLQFDRISKWIVK